MSIVGRYIRVDSGSTEENGYLEIAIADNATEPIYARQYEQNDTKNTKIKQNEVKLLDKSGNTLFPGTLEATNVKKDNETRLAAAESKITKAESDITNKANISHTHNSSDIIFNSSISFDNNSLDPRSITFQSGNDDKGRILFGSTGTDAGYLEIATADNGNEPIYVRQYQNNGTSEPFNTKKTRSYFTRWKRKHIVSRNINRYEY